MFLSLARIFSRQSFFGFRTHVVATTVCTTGVFTHSLVVRASENSVKTESKTHGTDVHNLRRKQRQYQKSTNQTPNAKKLDEMNKNSEQLSSLKRRERDHQRVRV